MENEPKFTPTNPEVPENFEDLLRLIEEYHIKYDEWFKKLDQLKEDEKTSKDEELNEAHLKILRLKLKLKKEGVDISKVPSLYKEGEHQGIITS